MEEMEETRFPNITWAGLPSEITRVKNKWVTGIGENGENDPFPRGIIGYDYLRDFAVRIQNEADVQNTIPMVHHQVLDLVVAQNATGKNIVTIFALRENAYRVSTRLVRQSQPDGGERYEALDLEAAVHVVKQMVHSLKSEAFTSGAE